jgi:hypothetical protein
VPLAARNRPIVRRRHFALIIRIGGGVVVEPEGSTTLEDCLARIRQLEEENAHLRAAAKTFGDLAERLKRALDAELRAGSDAGRAGLVK